MKQYRNKPVLMGVLAFLFVGMVSFTGDLSFPLAKGVETTSYVTTYSNGDTDTLEISREPNLAGASFGLYFADSVDIDRVIMQRLVNDKPAQAISADTLGSADSLTTAGSRLYTVTLAPIAQVYRFIVYYGNDAGGVQAGDAPNVTYYFHKQYYND